MHGETLKLETHLFGRRPQQVRSVTLHTT